MPGEEKKPNGIGPMNPPAATSIFPPPLPPGPVKEEMRMKMIPRKSKIIPIARIGDAIFCFFTIVPFLVFAYFWIKPF